MHCDFLPRMWKIIYRWCGKWKGWTEKCVARFVRWEICHWTLLWKRISLWYYCSVLDKNHGISCVSMGWEEEMSSIQSTKFERWSNVKSKALHHFLDIVRCGTSQEQATVLLSLETWSRFTRAWSTGIYPSKGKEAAVLIIHLTRSKRSLACSRIRQTETLRLTYTWLRGWIFQENIVSQSM